MTEHFGFSQSSTSDFLVYSRQGRKAVPKVKLENQFYLPIIELLQIIDLPYSESASAGFLTISVGKNQVKLTRDRSIVQINDSSLGLSAPVLFAGNRWLAPPELVSKVLNRILQEKIAIGGSGDRFSLVGFVRLSVKTVSTDSSTKIVIQMTGPAEGEIRREGSRTIISLGNVPIEPLALEGQHQDGLVNSISLEESIAANQIVVELTDKSFQTNITYLSSQSAYLIEVTRHGDQGKAGTEMSSLLPGTVKNVRDKRGWRHITVDAGHGGSDRGAFVSENIYEKDITLSIARKVRWALQTRLGTEVVLSRNDDRNLSLEERAAAANAAQSDLFLSIHVGNWSHPKDSRSHAYVIRKTPTASLDPKDGSSSSLRVRFIPWQEAQLHSLDWSIRLAEILQAEMNRALNGGNASLSFRQAPLKLLSTLAMPAVLLEIGNVNQPEYRKSVVDDRFQNLVAATVLVAVEKFRAIQERP